MDRIKYTNERKVTVSETSLGIATLRASRLLDVVRRAPTTPAKRVGLVVPLSEARRTLRLLTREKEQHFFSYVDRVRRNVVDRL